jgi:hypothetical protein
MYSGCEPSSSLIGRNDDHASFASPTCNIGNAIMALADERWFDSGHTLREPFWHLFAGAHKLPF